MKIAFLLIVLTKNGAGDINASFVNTETLKQCQQKALTLERVFLTSNIPVVESDCIQSNLTFSKFSHVPSSSKTRNFYLVELGNGVFHIDRISDWRTCMMQAKQEVKNARIYCSSSEQSLVE